MDSIVVYRGFVVVLDLLAILRASTVVMFEEEI